MREPRNLREYAAAHDLVEQQNAEGLEQGIALVSRSHEKEKRDAVVVMALIVVVLLALIGIGIYLSLRR